MAQQQKNIVILGSTGSIGRSALDIVRRNRRRFNVLGLAARQNIDSMWSQIREFSPQFVAVDHTPSARRLQRKVAPLKNSPRVLNHTDGLDRLAQLKGADLILCGMVGFRGLKPLVSALKAGKKVGLANKEALIVAGDLLTRMAKKYGATLIPVDSEHSAIFQCIKGENAKKIRRIILTASGGPFYKSKKNLKDITVEEALNHPTWKMGAKITVDSATLMNKGLEAIEAHHLFDIPMEKISIVIHPQSIVHSLVEFEDGAMLGQLSHPDMRLPIQFAMTYPERNHTPIKRLHLEEVGQLTFAKPDFSRFPCLRLALEAAQTGGTAPVVLSSSNEEAVQAFIQKRIRFTDIPRVVRAVVKKHPFKNRPSLDDIFKMDQWARETARNFIQKWEKN